MCGLWLAGSGGTRSLTVAERSRVRTVWAVVTVVVGCGDWVCGRGWSGGHFRNVGGVLSR